MQEASRSSVQHVRLVCAQDLTKISEPVSDEADEGMRMVPSFFGWFMPPDEDRAGDDELAEIIREHIWPNPLQLYMGEAVRAVLVFGA